MESIHKLETLCDILNSTEITEYDTKWELQLNEIRTNLNKLGIKDYNKKMEKVENELKRRGFVLFMRQNH